MGFDLAEFGWGQLKNRQYLAGLTGPEHAAAALFEFNREILIR